MPLDFLPIRQTIAGLPPVMADVKCFCCGRYRVIKCRVSQRTCQQEIMSRDSRSSCLFGQAPASGGLISSMNWTDTVTVVTRG